MAVIHPQPPRASPHAPPVLLTRGSFAATGQSRSLPFYKDSFASGIFEGDSIDPIEEAAAALEAGTVSPETGAFFAPESPSTELRIWVRAFKLSPIRFSAGSSRTT